MKGLSKSRYTAFCQCPKNLWLKVYKPNEATIDAGAEARFAQGNVVSNLAMGLFGNYLEVHAEKADGHLDLSKMAEQTRQWMDEGVENICEASFICEGGYCAVDILRKTTDGHKSMISFTSLLQVGYLCTSSRNRCFSPMIWNQSAVSRRV